MSMIKAGIYIHIPFCKSQCSYCDFATDVYKNKETVQRYVNALVREISDNKSQIQNRKSKIEVDSIFLGGGTPSLLSPDQVGEILGAVSKNFAICENTEITLEMNPGTVTPEKLAGYKSLGVNRASFGVQTFNDRSLKLLARGHNADDARQTFGLLRGGGFDNISFDLIAGLPEQTLEDWESNLEEALKLEPEHLSLYLLELHEGTPLAEQIRSGRRHLPEEELAAAMYELMLKRVRAGGYTQYEIANFSRPGFESRHNFKYWKFAPYYSFGVSAHSFDGKNRRSANVRDTARYVGLIEDGKSPVDHVIKLDPDARRGEYIFLRLRMNEGLDLSEFQKNFGFDLTEKYTKDINELRESGLIELIQGHLRLTDQGRLFSNEVFCLFI